MSCACFEISIADLKPQAESVWLSLSTVPRLAVQAAAVEDSPCQAFSVLKGSKIPLVDKRKSNTLKED